MSNRRAWHSAASGQTAVSAEIGRFERIIVRIWQLTSVFGVVTGAVYSLAISRGLGLGCAGASAGFLVWFAWVGYVLDRGNASRVLLTINTLVEALIPWTFTIVIVYTSGAAYALSSWVPPLLFASCIVAYVARLRPWLPLVFGAAGAVLYSALYFLLIRGELTEAASRELINQPATQLTRSVALLGGGMLAMLLTVGLRHVVRVAESSSNVLGRYRLGPEVGSSPTGVVYAAQYQPDGGFERSVMLRRLPPGTSEHADLVAAFRKQAELATRLVHPNIVQVLDFGMSGSTHVVVTEFTDAVTLDVLQKRVISTSTPLDPALVRHIGTGILSGLSYAHEGARDDEGNPFGHWMRDLSPTRVFLYRSGEVKIGGYSVPPSLRDIDRTPYTAPEQANGICDARSDLFSTAAILWELLSAQPFSLEAVATVQFDPATGWDVFFAQALALDPAERVRSASELLGLLEPFAAPMHDKAVRAMSSLVNALKPRNRVGA